MMQHSKEIDYFEALLSTLKRFNDSIEMQIVEDHI